MFPLSNMLLGEGLIKTIEVVGGSDDGSMTGISYRYHSMGRNWNVARGWMAQARGRVAASKANHGIQHALRSSEQMTDLRGNCDKERGQIKANSGNGR